MNKNQAYYTTNHKATREKYLNMGLLSSKDKEDLVQRGREMADKMKKSMELGKRTCQ